MEGCSTKGIWQKNISSCTVWLTLALIYVTVAGQVDWEAWEERMGVFVRNLSTMTVVHLVNVSRSSGAGSPRLTRIKAAASAPVILIIL